MVNPLVPGLSRQRYKGQRPCEVCSELFWWHPKMRVRFCSNRCRGKANPPRPRWSTVARRTHLRWRTCDTCRQWFLPGGQRQTCSDRCRRSLLAHNARTKRLDRRHPAVCQVCGGQFLTNRWGALYCGAACAGRSPVARAAVKAGKRRRRARERGAVTVERFTDVEVFERDGWRCGLCRRKVKRHVSVPHPEAPTIDHVVPLADGGQHTRANVQCAHFLCNSLKSAGGSQQLRMLG